MMPMKGPQGTPAPPLVAYCERHLPPDQAAAREASLEAEAEEEEEEEGGVGAPLFELRRSRSLPARTPRRRGPPSPSFPPSSSTASSPTPERSSSEFASSREARRGASLLERLHLEPWRRPGKRLLPLRAEAEGLREGGVARACVRCDQASCVVARSGARVREGREGGAASSRERVRRVPKERGHRARRWPLSRARGRQGRREKGERADETRREGRVSTSCKYRRSCNTSPFLQITTARYEMERGRSESARGGRELRESRRRGVELMRRETQRC